MKKTSCDIYLTSCKVIEAKAKGDYFNTRAGRATHLCQVARNRGKEGLVVKLYTLANKLEAQAKVYSEVYKQLKRG